jgi:hypothetical protein
MIDEINIIGGFLLVIGMVAYVILMKRAKR